MDDDESQTSNEGCNSIAEPFGNGPFRQELLFMLRDEIDVLLNMIFRHYFHPQVQKKFPISAAPSFLG
jgi:hypothetical protein